MFHVGNEAVVDILNSRASPDPNIMHLLRSLLKVAACFSFTFAAIPVPGRNNGIADALSCFNFSGLSFSSATGQGVSNPHPSSALSQAFHSHLDARCLLFM